MIKKKIINKERVRRIDGGFAFIPRQERKLIESCGGFINLPDMQGEIKYIVDFIF